MDCAPVTKLPSGPEWLFEIKLDGYRAIAVKTDVRVNLFSWRHKLFNHQYPHLVEALAELPEGTVVDGEVVALDESGRPNFNLLQNLRNGARQTPAPTLSPVPCHGRGSTLRIWSTQRKSWILELIKNPTQPAFVRLFLRETKPGTSPKLSFTAVINASTIACCVQAAIRTLEANMHPWSCAALIVLAGAVGGFVNALISDNGFALPRRLEGVLCPGALSTIFIGAFAAFASWAFYGSGAGLSVTDPKSIQLPFPAVAGAFLVGVVGAKWLTNEADKRLLKESVGLAAAKNIPKEEVPKIMSGSPLEVLEKVSSM